VRHEWLEGDSLVLRLSTHGGDYWLSAPGIADFCVRFAPSRVGVHVTGGMVDAAALEHQLVDQVLPRLLDHLGELMLHASAVRMGGRLALFLAPSGAGKSTLAALLQLRGHQVLSDDCVQLRPVDGDWTALPTYPSLRLLADSLQAVYPLAADARPVAGYSSKRRLAMASREAIEPAAVDAIYVLGDGDQGDITIAPLAAADACLSLIHHSFRMDLSDRAATIRHFARCGEMARSVPSYRFAYPRNFDRHDDIATAITRHVAASEAHGVLPGVDT